MTTMIFYAGKFIEINENTEFFVGRCSSSRTVFGEKAKLHKILKKNLVFITESGSLVKTTIDTMMTVGKAAKNNYWVGLGNRTNYINERVHYWNTNKCCIEYK